MSKQPLFTYDNIYSHGPLYNLLADERGSFYRDIHGLVELISFLPSTAQGILELGSCSDSRGARLIQHEFGDEVEYVRDADLFVDLTIPQALPKAHGRKYSVVTAQCYLLNALVRAGDWEPVGYDDLVTALRNIRSVLTEDGFAVFGIYEPQLRETYKPVCTKVKREPSPAELRRFQRSLPAGAHIPEGSLLSYRVEQHVEHEVLLVSDYLDIKLGPLEFKIKEPLFANLWSDVEIHNAALEAGFWDIQFYEVKVSMTEAGFSEFHTAPCSRRAKRANHASHVVLRARL